MNKFEQLIQELRPFIPLIRVIIEHPNLLDVIDKEVEKQGWSKDIVPPKDFGVEKPKLIYDCMLEAIKAHGNTPEIHKWYKKWKPNYLKMYGIITMQYSLSCQLMSDVVELIEDKDNLDKILV